MDINYFCSERIIDFVDLVHAFLKERLSSEFGENWFNHGVARHVGRQYIDRVRLMLDAPLRVVDMGKQDEELYGIEHIASVVDGNWDLFKPTFMDRDRTKVYLPEVAEVRHNIAHRRARHILSRNEVLRCVSSCHLLLRAIGAPQAADFERLVDGLSSGDTPWGPPLAGELPPADTVVTEFVERPQLLDALTSWFTSDSTRCLVWGDGGAGKSSIAFEFARRVRAGGVGSILAVCWVSAKSVEFVEGSTRPRVADFMDVPSAARAVRQALYSEDITEEYQAEDLLKELDQVPALVIIDDLDSVLNDEATAEFLTYRLPQTKSKILFTSRLRVPGLQTVEVLGLTAEELTIYLKSRAHMYNLNEAEVEKRVKAIARVTVGYPLYIDDLLRLGHVFGLDDAIAAWGQRKGDAAREYALRRQLERLPEPGREVLMAIAMSNRSWTLVDLAAVTGRSDDDVELAIRSLRDWCLVARALLPDGTLAFDTNQNTKRLVQRTFGGIPAWKALNDAIRTHESEMTSLAKSKVIGSIIGRATALVLRGDAVGALSVIREGRIGDLENEADLISASGWVCARCVPPLIDEARSSFEEAHKRGSRKIDTYKHWVEMERRLAEDLEYAGSLGQWVRVYTAAEKGVERLEGSQSLLYYAGLGRARNAKQLARGYHFDRARMDYAKASSYFRQALVSEQDSNWPILRPAIHRGVVLAFEGLEAEQELHKAILAWEREYPDDKVRADELVRLSTKFPRLSDR